MRQERYFFPIPTISATIPKNGENKTILKIYSTRIIIIFLELSAILHTSARENSNDVILNDTPKLVHRSTKLSY